MIYAVIQFVVIAAMVAVSLWQVAKKLMPSRVHAIQVKGSAWLNRKSMPVPVQVIGKSLQPASAPAAGCGSGCASCKACASFNIKKI